MNLYRGEIHSHNKLGCGQDSLERSYEIDRPHQDL
jgi:hypothetical protein